MAGHSAWSNIKHRKGRVDAKRSKVWSKIAKAIIVAARLGGGDPDSNLRLRYAVADARAASMPKDTIDRAIKRGTGELDGGNVEETVYEGYGPAGVAVMCDIMTDNRNRTASEVRKIFDVHGGKLGQAGCVSWMFERRGVILVSAAKAPEDRLMEAALEAGADDVRRVGENFEITCVPDQFATVTEAFDKAGIPMESKEFARVPANTVELDVDAARQVLKLMEALDDHDDVQSVSANFSIPDEALTQLAAS
ncbi:MAG: YebC/PmpR family DNA-binding transcriptional regulator [Pirellulales bacterium]